MCHVLCVMYYVSCRCHVLCEENFNCLVNHGYSVETSWCGENFRVVIDILFGDKFLTCVGHFCLLTKCRLVLDILFVDKSF